MKKALVILLIPVFLLATTIGVSMTSHFCGGKLQEKGFNVKTCCKDVNKGGCCKTESELVKVKDNFIKSATDINFNSDFLLQEIPVKFDSKPVGEVSSLKSYWDKAPPFLSNDLYILFRSLII